MLFTNRINYTKRMSKFVTDFIKDEIIPIEIVSEITGLTIDEILKTSNVIELDDTPILDI